MTTDQLISCGVALYGRHWQTDLAEAIGISPRTMRRWVAGNPVPDGAIADIAELMQGRADILRLMARGINAKS